MANKHHNLIRSLDYLAEVIRKRLEHHFAPTSNGKSSLALSGFTMDESEDPFSHFVISSKLTIEEFIVLLLVLAPHVVPNFFERLVNSYLKKGGDFPEFGGVKSGQTRYMLPTVSTALFLLAGEDFARRLDLMEIFDAEHLFAKYNVISLEEIKGGDPILGAKIVLNSDYVDLFTKGRVAIPQLSTSFPAQRLATGLNWTDLIVAEKTLQQLSEIKIWMQYNDRLMKDWGMGKRLKPGYRALFYGPPGTGKTLAASLIGKYTGTEVLRVDLSQVVSKYIGETEKNLSNLFKKAEYKGWCLFFDEADACFGKRSTTKDAKDRYANQEIAYLLQRIENYQGLIILATNFKSNIDEAFLRRFNSIVHFPMPRAPERRRIWERAFPTQAKLTPEINFTELAQQYEMSGSNIMNTVHYACLQAMAAETDHIQKNYVVDGIAKEYAKEGKVL